MKKIVAVAFAALVAVSASTAFAADGGGYADRINESRSFPYSEGQRH